MTSRILPIGIQTFREMIERDCYYFDTTEGSSSLDMWKSLMLVKGRQARATDI